MDPDTCWVDGKLGKALEFDGINDYVNCGNDPSLHITDAITIEAWVKLNELGGGTAGTDKWIAGRGQADITHLRIGNGNLVFGWGDSVTGDALSGGSITINNWYHVVGTIEGYDAKIYVNGVEVNSKTSTKQANYTGAAGWRISRYWSTYGYFNGTIDEVGIYSRALTEDEIYQHYLEGGGE